LNDFTLSFFLSLVTRSGPVPIPKDFTGRACVSLLFADTILSLKVHVLEGVHATFAYVMYNLYVEVLITRVLNIGNIKDNIRFGISFEV
jgi:hypothetical protein